MKLEQFDPAAGAAEVRACHEIYLAGHPIDDPYGPPMSARYFAGWLTLGWTEDPQEVWLARDSQGGPRGCYLLGLPHRENQHLAMLWPTVHPAHRRTGLGCALVRHAAGRARQSGRTVLSGWARDGSPGSAFAAAIGARPGITQVGRVLRLRDLPAGRLAALRAQAEPAAAGTPCCPGTARRRSSWSAAWPRSTPQLSPTCRGMPGRRRSAGTRSGSPR